MCLEWFELQEAFARKAGALESLSLPKALMTYTCYYTSIGTKDYEFNPKNEAWQKLLVRLETSPSAARAACGLALTVKPHAGKSKAFGCFGYDIRKRGTTASIHFGNTDRDPQGPLSKGRLSIRRIELATMFRFIRERHPSVQFVEGYSWLYNYEAYCSLFPDEFSQNKKKSRTMPMQFRSSWGQFLTSNGSLHVERADAFRKRIEDATTCKDLERAFPLKVFRTSAPIAAFYEQYAIP